MPFASGSRRFGAVGAAAIVTCLSAVAASPAAQATNPQAVRAALSDEMPGIAVTLPTDPGTPFLPGAVKNSLGQSVGANVKVVLMAGPTRSALL